MGRKPAKYASVRCDDGDEGLTTVTATSASAKDGFLWLESGEPIKPKRRNGRLKWKPRALRAESDVVVYQVLTVAGSVVGFVLGFYYF